MRAALVLRVWKKRWWRFKTHHSLWSSFLKAKYYSEKDPVARKCCGNTSNEWKNLMNVKNIAKPNMIWNSTASCNFEWDNWTGKGALANLCPNVSTPTKTLVSDFIDDLQWNVNKLEVVFPSHDPSNHEYQHWSQIAARFHCLEYLS